MNALTVNRLWNVKEAAAYLNVSVDTMYYWHSTGDGPVVCKIGKHLRYRFADVLAWVEQSSGK